MVNYDIKFGFPTRSKNRGIYIRVVEDMSQICLLHKCTKIEGFPTSRGLNLKIKPCWQHYGLPMAMK